MALCLIIIYLLRPKTHILSDIPSLMDWWAFLLTLGRKCLDLDSGRESPGFDGKVGGGLRHQPADRVVALGRVVLSVSVRLEVWTVWNNFGSIWSWFPVGSLVHYAMKRVLDAMKTCFCSIDPPSPKYSLFWVKISEVYPGMFCMPLGFIAHLKYLCVVSNALRIRKNSY